MPGREWRHLLPDIGPRDDHSAAVPEHAVAAAAAEEIGFVMPMFQQQGNRAAAESLQWVLLNKLDFIFNY